MLVSYLEKKNPLALTPSLNFISEQCVTYEVKETFLFLLKLTANKITYFGSEWS